MGLDKVLQLAVILAWEDFVKVATPCSVRIEYVSEPKTPLDMRHQDQFTSRPDAGRHGLVLIHPSTGEECTEAAAWMSGVPDLATHSGGASGQNAP